MSEKFNEEDLKHLLDPADEEEEPSSGESFFDLLEQEVQASAGGSFNEALTEDPFDTDSEEVDFLTPTQIYEQLAAEGELLITIPTEEAQGFRSKISNAKAKRNERLKEQGLPPDNRKFLFSAPVISKEDPSVCTIHVQLSEQQGIRIIKIEKPDNTL